jgi:carbon-monoxide dehydrogenase medium subunit
MEAELRPLPKFNYFSPSSLGETFKMLKDYKGKSRLLAGGTDLLVKMKKGAVSPDVVVDLSKISELSFIELAGGSLRIGGLTRLADIGESSLVREKAPALAEAIDVLASSQVRNRATIAGNLCNASPAADTAPPLLALDASVKLQSPDGERIVPLAEFFLGPEQTVAKPEEVLTEVIIPLQEGTSAFIKLGRRKAFTLSVTSVAAFARVNKGRFEEVRVALGAVAPTPMRARKVEEALKGKEANKENIEKAAESVKEECCPITDVRASAEYRTEMSYVLTKRVLGKTGLGEK